MAYHFETVKLEKGMYGRSGRTFSQTLEELDPSEHYRGTALEGLDAFQRQLKRFDIKVKGTDSDCVEKFFRTADAAVLFPEYVSRCVRQGMDEVNVLPQIAAAVTRIDGMDYRILVEADFLVNLFENHASLKSIRKAYDTMFETQTGKALLQTMFSI